VVTFLFTDVEGSTRRWEADADEMRVALAAHDKGLRKAVEAHGGWLFKHTGDGVCAAFASPRSAVNVVATSAATESQWSHDHCAQSAGPSARRRTNSAIAASRRAEAAASTHAQPVIAAITMLVSAVARSSGSGNPVSNICVILVVSTEQRAPQIRNCGQTANCG
jgi:class 3 adenylate cyclase